MMVELTCSDCRFQIPAYARREILQKPDISTDEFTCPTCGAAYRVSVQQTRGATLAPERLNNVKNRNR